MTDQDALKALLLLVEEKRTQLSRGYVGGKIPTSIQEKLNRYVTLRQWLEVKLTEVQDEQ